MAAIDPASGPGASSFQPRPSDDAPFVHDIGFTEVYNPSTSIPNKDAIVDIVFVHGLQGHPRDTWTHKDDPRAPQRSSAATDRTQRPSRFRRIFGRSEAADQTAISATRPTTETSNACFWPYHLLSKDEVMSGARILVYGYNSKPTNFYKSPTTEMTITQHARQLNTRLAQERSRSQGRPLIFVAHSLGGILVKDALDEARQDASEPANRDIATSCHAVVFMGTPHLGSNAAAWGEVLSNIVGTLPGGPSTFNKVLRGLQPESEILDRITRNFNRLLDGNQIRICTVQEGLGLTGIKGASNKVVKDSSAAFNRPAIERILVNETANHMSLCKFPSENHPTYKDVLWFLQQCCERIQKNQGETRKDVESSERELQSEISRKADFANRLDKERQLNTLEVNSESFDWIWSSAFADWLKSDAKIFWIAGKPASGKSTLVNYLAKQRRTRELAAIATGQHVKIAKFFFDFRGRDGITNNFEGLRRSLLYQLLRASAILAAKVGEQFGLAAHEDVFSLKSSDILEFVLQKNGQPWLIFIDGLDEFQGEKSELLDLVNNLLKFNVRICLSSRNEKPFSVAYSDLGHTFLMDRVNQLGIKAYARGRFETALKPRHDRDRQNIDSAAKIISERFAGVFLWARFAVLKVMDTTFDGHEIAGPLRDIVDRMPSELEQVYARIFNSIRHDEDKRRSCGLLMQLIDAAGRDLHVAELFEAMLIAGDGFRSLDKTMDNNDLFNFRRYVGAVGAGLIEIVPDKNLREDQVGSRTDVASIRMIHRTVQTYLNKTGWTELLGTPPAMGFQQRLWIQICTSLLAGKRVNWVSKSKATDQSFNTINRLPRSSEHRNTQPQWPPHEKGLQDYVSGNLMLHALNYERETRCSSRALLQKTLNAIIASGSVLMYLEDFTYHRFDNDLYRRLICSDVHMATFHGLCLYVEESMTQSPEIITMYVESITDALPSGHGSRKSNSVDWQLPSERMCNPSLLSTAVCGFIMGSDAASTYTSMGLRLFEFLAPLSPRLNDSDMLMAIQELSKIEIEALLTRFPGGQLELRSSFLYPDLWSIVQYGISLRRLRSEYVFGPLWAVGSRHPYDRGTAEVLRLFLERGEDINSQCGPSGTLLHAAARAASVINLDKKEMDACFRMYIAHGANSNAAGPQGNVLEYTWERAHIDSRPDHPFWRYCGRLIEVLIDLEIPNSVCDPNGQIPSKERMLAVAKRQVPNAQDMTFYYYGTTTRSAEWRTREDGRQERWAPRSSRQRDDAEDAASIYSTVSRSNSESEDASEGAAEDEEDLPAEEGVMAWSRN